MGSPPISGVLFSSATPTAAPFCFLRRFQSRNAPIISTITKTAPPTPIPAAAPADRPDGDEDDADDEDDGDEDGEFSGSSTDCVFRGAVVVRLYGGVEDLVEGGLDVAGGRLPDADLYLAHIDVN